MLTPKHLLLQQTTEAFRGRPDMPLMASLTGITQEEASWQPDESAPSIEQIIRHIAWAKSRFCSQGFNQPMVLIDLNVNDDGDSPNLPNEFPCGSAYGTKTNLGIHGAIQLLEQSQVLFIQCLQSCPDEALDQPIPTHHGKSAANFFWTMLMHDIYHAGQIRTRRTFYRIRNEGSRSAI